MKVNIYVSIIGVLLVIMIMLLGIKLDERYNCTDTIDSLNNIIHKQDSSMYHKDSIYWAHLANCMYITRDMIGTDNNGFMYIKSDKQMTFDMWNKE